MNSNNCIKNTKYDKIVCIVFTTNPTEGDSLLLEIFCKLWATL